jgi:hypothetical protein
MALPIFIFHTAIAKITARIHASGRARFAGQLNPTIRTTVTMMGMKARIANIYNTSLKFYLYKRQFPRGSARFKTSGNRECTNIKNSDVILA